MNTISALEQQLAKVERQIQDFTDRTRKARSMLEAMAQDLGLGSLNLTPPKTQTVTPATTNGPTVAQKIQKAKVKAKAKSKPGKVLFRDPANQKNQWTGRGPAPKWLAAYEKAGRNRSEFSVA